MSVSFTNLISGKRLEVGLAIVFLLALVVEVVLPPWTYYSLGEALRKPPYVTGFLAFLNHLEFIGFGWVGLLFNPLICAAFTALILQVEERRVYHELGYALFLLMLTSILMGYFDVLFFDRVSEMGGAFGRAIQGILPQGVWMILFIVILLYFLASLTLSHYFGVEMTLALRPKGKGVVEENSQDEDEEIGTDNEEDEDDESEPEDDPIEEVEPDDNDVEPRHTFSLPSNPVRPPVKDLDERVRAKGKNIRDHNQTEDDHVEEEPGLDLEPHAISPAKIDHSIFGPIPTRPRVRKEDFDAIAAQIKGKLAEFQVNVQVEFVSRGPILALFRIKPDRGVKLAQILALELDLRKEMARGRAGEIRFDTASGEDGLILEVPLHTRSDVPYRDVLADNDIVRGDSPCFIVGVTTGGKPVTVTLESMPHLLIAGTTNSGKSVFLNNVIVDLAMHYSPDEIRFVLADMKQVELGNYSCLPHLAHPIVKDAEELGRVLEKLILEMERRNGILSELRVRSLKEYRELMRATNRPVELMTVALIIDEVGDALMVGGKDLRDKLIRLAQMGRAAGIHVIAATQGVTVDIISSSIKRNFPAKICFHVAKASESRVLLDCNGGEKLLGLGDMLFTRPGERLTRLHGCLLDSKEIALFNQQFSKQGNREAKHA